MEVKILTSTHLSSFSFAKTFTILQEVNILTLVGIEDQDEKEGMRIAHVQSALLSSLLIRVEKNLVRMRKY